MMMGVMLLLMLAVIGFAGTLRLLFYSLLFTGLIWHDCVMFIESVYYCEQGQEVVIHNKSGTIITRRPDVGYYDNNMDCTWVIETPGEEDNIYLRVDESMLAWAPETANCIGHDYVEVLRGTSGSCAHSSTALVDCRQY